MDIRQKKASIYKKLERATNEKLLKKVEDLLDSFDLVAGYQPNGEVLTYNMLQDEIAEGEAEFKTGQGTSQQELREQVKQWSKKK